MLLPRMTGETGLGVTLTPEHLMGVNSLAIFLSIPLFHRVGYPLLERWEQRSKSSDNNRACSRRQ